MMKQYNFEDKEICSLKPVVAATRPFIRKNQPVRK